MANNKLKFHAAAHRRRNHAPRPSRPVFERCDQLRRQIFNARECGRQDQRKPLRRKYFALFTGGFVAFLMRNAQFSSNSSYRPKDFRQQMFAKSCRYNDRIRRSLCAFARLHPAGGAGRRHRRYRDGTAGSNIRTSSRCRRSCWCTRFRAAGARVAGLLRFRQHHAAATSRRRGALQQPDLAYNQVLAVGHLATVKVTDHRTNVASSKDGS